MSFRRVKPSTQPPPPTGTLVFPTVPLPTLSTGLASLDDVIAPGQPLSSALLVLAPDGHTAWGKLIQRYWLSAGLLAGQGVVVAGGEGENDELVSGAMWVAGGGTVNEAAAAEESDGEDVVDETGEGKGGKRIAWRYGGMAKFKTTVDASSSSGNAFSYNLSLTHSIPAATVATFKSSGQLIYLTVDPRVAQRGGSKGKQRESCLDRLLSELRQLVEDGGYSHATPISAENPPRALRIALPNLFSPSYGDVTFPEMARFLHSLRSLLRTSRTCALLTLPPHLASQPHLTSRLSHLTDATLTLQGFQSDATLPLLFPSHHGLLSTPKSFALQSLAPPNGKLSTLVGGKGGRNNLAFKLKRKAFVVETMHLDIDGGVGERRTKPAEKVGTEVSAAGGGAHGHGHGGHRHGHGHSHGEGQDEEAAALGGRVRIEAEPIQTTDESKPVAPAPAQPRKSALKKKSVGFATIDPSKPELYEF